MYSRLLGISQMGRGGEREKEMSKSEAKMMKCLS